MGGFTVSVHKSHHWKNPGIFLTFNGEINHWKRVGNRDTLSFNLLLKAWCTDLHLEGGYYSKRGTNLKRCTIQNSFSTSEHWNTSVLNRNNMW